MSFYDQEASWQASGRQPSWEQPPPPSRSGTSSALSQPTESGAFASQFEEIDRATDNLMKSGKWYPGAAMAGPTAGPPRRDSMPPVGRGFDGYGGDMRIGGPSRHHSVSEFDSGRPGSAGLQGYYAGQRFPGGRQSEAEQMLQQKRRMAAQRERELRNYHQEQQYNRTAVSGVKTDRSMSPNTMSEDDRRDLIARQHRALYGEGSNIYSTGDGGSARAQSQDVRPVGSQRGTSPLAFDPYGTQAQGGAEASVQMPPRDRQGSTASPAGATQAQQQFSLLNEQQSNRRTSNSSPGGSPPLSGGSKVSGAGVAPIGTRPVQASGPVGLNKRSTTPLTPSSLSYGFSSSDAQNSGVKTDDRSTSSASNPPLEKGVSGLGGWGGNSGVWGGGKNLAVQPSVWDPSLTRPQSSPRPQSPVDTPPTTGSTTARPSSPKAPGGPAAVIRRKAAADRDAKVANARPSSTRAAGAGGSSSTMLRLYTDESPGLKVDPFVVMVLSIGFIISVVALHIIAKITKRFSS
ncbi:Protein transport protein Sec61 subunit beta [Teratosphaeria destructans]|uniref:Protein transport protein Sec61 subunit beta n=1 Tax=Teratosphaeria destructans TaxID=418781 RepID=A0A9W7W6M3_9PEZI|nr:Protein transport protein Sec61 subunit beta [Teratosphaeria destructans]